MAKTTMLKQYHGMYKEVLGWNDAQRAAANKKHAGRKTVICVSFF